MKVKMGIIGLGKAWEQLHGPAYARLQDQFEITAVCAKDEAHARSVAAFLGLPESSAYGSYPQMLKRADIEAVDTMVPIDENYECAKAVIKSRKHLLAEKPFGASPRSAKELIRLKDQYGVTVMVAENYRYEQENVLIKNLITENRIGTVLYFLDHHTTEFQNDMLQENAFSNTEWRKHPSFRGGVFLDSGVHHIARHRFLFGRVNRVYAAGRPLSGFQSGTESQPPVGLRSDAEFAPYSHVSALLTFNNQVSGHYSFCVVSKETQAPLTGLRIFGTEGEIYLENRDCGYVNVTGRNGQHEAIPYTPGEGYYHELRHFYEAVRNNGTDGSQPVVSTPEKELGDIEVVYGILDSIAKDKLIKLNDSFNPEGQ